MLQSIVRFSNDAAAIEKTLRGLQGFATIAVGLAQSQHDIDFWLKLRGQLALGTRHIAGHIAEHTLIGDDVGVQEDDTSAF